MKTRTLLAGLLAVLFVLPQYAMADPTPTALPAAASAQGVLRTTLANGMRVVLLANKLAPVATAMISYGVGADDDTMPGIAHATEHMLFRGTKNVSAGQLSDIAARMGANYNAMTANEYTLYYFELPSAYVDVALHLEADRMTAATIGADEWNTERGAIEQEIRAQQSVPGYAIGRKLQSEFFAGTPFAQAGGGTIPSFHKMKSTDIRDFYHAWYHPNNATLIIAGDIDPQLTLAHIHSLFDAIPAAPLPERKPIQVGPLASTTLRDRFDFPVGMTALLYRLPGSNDPDYAASELAVSVLNSQRGAFADLTASGKVLAAFCGSSAYPEVGISFALAIPAQGSTPESAQALLSAALDQYKKSGLPSDLIAAAKTRMLSAQAARQASISGLAFAWAGALAERHDSPDDIYRAIETITDDDVNRVFRKYFNTEHQMSVVLTANPSSTMPKVNPNAGVENVAYTPKVHEALPTWSLTALSAPLRPPSNDRRAVTTHFPNGLTLTVRRETTAPIVILEGVTRDAPDLYEPKGKDGVDTLVERLLPWGTTTYDRKAFQEQLDAIAASATLGTSFDLTVQSKDFDRGMQLLADGLLHPGFAESAFNVLQAKLAQAIAVGEKLPATKAAIAETNALYPPGDPRRRNATVKTITSIHLNDVRRWHSFAYRPDETTIAIVGDVTPAQAESAVRKFFGSWAAHGPRPTFIYPNVTRKSMKNETVTVTSASNAQSQVTLKQVIDIRRTDDDYVALLLANTILSGEGTGSLLFQDVRTHSGYVYNIDSDVEVDQSSATFTINFSSDPKNVNRAQAAAVAIIKRLQRVPLAPVELQRAKALLLARRVLPLDSYDGVALNILADAKYGLTSHDSDRFWHALLQTTPAQLQHAVQRIQTDRFLRVIVAPGR